MANIGAYIKGIVDDIKIENMDEFCRIHLNMSKQSFYKNLKKTSLNSDLILRYCVVFNRNFFAHFYEEEPLKSFQQKEIEGWNAKIAIVQRNLDDAQKLIETKDELLETQRKLIAELEAKLKR